MITIYSDNYNPNKKVVIVGYYLNNHEVQEGQIQYVKEKFILEIRIWSFFETCLNLVKSMLKGWCGAIEIIQLWPK